MLRALRGHYAEIFILATGAAAALAQDLLTDNRDLLVIIVVISLLLAGMTLSIKIVIGDLLRGDIGKVLEQITNAQWHEAARLKVDLLRAELREWAEGRRIMRGDAGLVYQVGLVARTRENLDAIHLALGERSLKRWDKETGEFSEFVNAHERLSRRVRGRRIMVLDDEHPGMVAVVGGQKIISDERAIRVCLRQLQPRRNGGLGFDVRVLWKTEYLASHPTLPPDLLIADRSEAIIVRNVSPVAASDDYETEALTSAVRVVDYRALFDDLWQIAVPARRLLPAAPPMRRLLRASTWFSRPVQVDQRDDADDDSQNRPPRR
jgi:hypothetical protein